MSDMTKPQKQFISTDNAVIVRAPAKINLTLLIPGKRDDGFHSIETIMSKITWYDEIIIENSSKNGIELICKGPCWAPQDETNSVFMACKLFCETTGYNKPIKATLIKNIPAGTGLGSASSDGASALLALNIWTEMGLSKEQLCYMASQIGSDTPFFTGGPMAYCTGRGEKISQIEDFFDYRAIIFVPDISVSTAMVYKNYKHDINRYKILSDEINPLITKKRVDLAAKMCANMLEQSCYEIENGLATLNETIKKTGVGTVCLSGSGSAIYCLPFDQSDEGIKKAYAIVSEKISCRSLVVSNNRW